MRTPSLLRCLALTLACAELARAQAPDTSLWVANGTVNAVVPMGGTLFIGGDFTRVGPNTGCAVPFDPVTAQPIVPFARVPGRVNAIVPDGGGGWYVGGLFDGVDGHPTRNLVHLLADGQVAPWTPQPDSEVLALSLSGSTLYVGGRFEHLGGAARYKLGAVDVTSGAATAFDAGMTLIAPNLWPNVITITATPSVVYVGGRFNMIGGQPRVGAAALDPATGLATAWNPQSNGDVYRFIPSGGSVYVAGQFTSIGGQTRNRLAELDATTALANLWAPPPTNGIYMDMVLTQTQVYVSGVFGLVNGVQRSSVAAFDRGTGALLPFDVSIGATTIPSIALDGNTLYLAGNFSQIASQPRKGLAAVNASTGAPLPWAPDIEGDVAVIGGANEVVVSGGVVFAAGAFRSVGGVARSRLAALDLTTGRPTAWAPAADDVVRDMTTDGTWLFIGGEFLYVNGTYRPFVGRVSVAIGTLDPSWAPALAMSSIVNCLSLSGPTLFVGGYITSIFGTIVALDANTASVLPWAPATSGGPVNHIVPDPANGAVTVASQGGFWRFSFPGGATLWSASITGAAYTTTQVGNTVYLGGTFLNVNGEPRDHLAAFDAATGTLLPWAPAANRDVVWLTNDGTRVYAAGRFSTISGQARPSLAVLDAATGALDPFDGGLGGDDRGNGFNIYRLTVAGADLYPSGYFTSADGFATPGFGRLPGAPPLGVGSTGADGIAFTVAPVPARARAQLRWSLPRASVVSIDVLDAQGRRVARPLAGSWQASGSGFVTLETRGWRPGVYLVRLRAGRVETIRRIVVAP